MKKLHKIFFVLTIGFLFSNCNPDKTTETEAARDYATQYTTDKTDIETFLKTHSITFDASYTITSYPVVVLGDASAIWARPDLMFHTYTQDDVDYKIYYLKLRQGSGTDSVTPCNVDSILTQYTGTLIDGTKFDFNDNPQSFFNLEGVIKGWSEIFPQFSSAGSHVTNANGTVTFNNFGAGVMFVPSGLGYFSNTQTSIPAYSPLIFSFKLFAVNRLDQDGDGIPSYQEDLDGDNYVRYFASGVVNPDDTDGDFFPNYLDSDDDGDNVLTKTEIRNPTTGVAYPFASIPICAASGKKVHLDATCK